MAPRTSETIRHYAISWYNELQQDIITLTYPFVRLKLCHETGSKKLTNFIFGSKTYPFRWFVHASEVFSKDSPAPTLISIHPLPPAQQSIHSSRRDVGFDLSNCAWTRTHRNLSSIKTEWSLPIPYGSSHLSQSYDIAALPSPNGPARSSKTEDTSGPITSLSDAKTQTSDQDHLRSGLYGSSPLWQTRDGSDRVQSQKVGQTFLPSPCLFQRNHQRFLAWRTSSGRHTYRDGRSRTFKGLLCQATSFSQTRNYPSRQGILRPRNHPIFRIHKALFVIVAKLTQPIKRKLSGLSYRVHSYGLETSEFLYQPTGWKKEYRFVVIRRPVPEDSTEQLTLFSMGKYSYQVIVTNMTLTPLPIPLNPAGCSDLKRPLVPIETGHSLSERSDAGVDRFFT
jgi:hypothetical protein